MLSITSVSGIEFHLSTCTKFGRCKGVLDRFVDYIGEGAEDSGRSMKRVQNGNVENYVLIMTLAVGIILIVNFILQ